VGHVAGVGQAELRPHLAGEGGRRRHLGAIGVGGDRLGGLLLCTVRMVEMKCR
jgi:hypothetical protein